VSCSLSSNGVAQGDYVIASESDKLALAGCTEVTGELFVSDSTDMLLNLNGLETLVQLGSLRTGDSLQDHIRGLLNIDGLSGLESVGDIRVRSNPVLHNLHGVAGIKGIVEGLEVADNDALVDITGLSGISDVENWLAIKFNPSLPALAGLDNIETARGIAIHGNQSLTTLDGLSVTSVDDVAILQSSLLDISALSSVTGTLEFLSLSHNNLLSDLEGLSNVTQVEDLYLTFNGDLSDVSGLSSLA